MVLVSVNVRGKGKGRGKEKRKEKSVHLVTLSICYLHSHMQHILFQNFHAIRSREDLTLVLFDWEFVNSEDNLYGLFDEDHAIKKLNQAAKVQETQRQKQLGTMDTGSFVFLDC